MCKKRQKRYRNNGKYIDDFLRLECAKDWHAWDLFPNPAEITESLSMYYAVAGTIFKGNDAVRKDSSINLVVVGDGGSPRTAAVFATMTRWQCYSIDPEMRPKWEDQQKIGRLTTFLKRVEDVNLEFTTETVVVLPHSHAKCKDTLLSIKSPKTHLVTMACCVPMFVPNIPHNDEYRDKHVWSPHNLIKIWTDLTPDRLERMTMD